jgi:Fur family ferric uptake transcriptional regulator
MHHARATLREMGYRLTPQRVAVWEALRARGGHMAAEDVAHAVHETLPELNLSTVYRTLELLVQLGLVTETRLAGARAYYEVEPGSPHHHYVCERCGLVGHFDDHLMASLYEELQRSAGFDASHAQATIFGLCEGCRSQEVGAVAERLHAHP